MKSSRAEIRRRVHKIPHIRFEGHELTSFAGLVLFQKLFAKLDLKARLRQAVGSLDKERDYGLSVVILQLVVHVLVGFTRLRDRDYYAHDPLVRRVLGVSKVPDVATISRTLAAATMACVDRLRVLLSELVLERLHAMRLARVTLDFDGSVLSTKRQAEGTAVGFNRKREGARSYYPLFCTIPQVGQFLDVHHRPGNVHDSNGATDFIALCVERVRKATGATAIESRLDSAFFSDEVLAALERMHVRYSVSVPFERFVGLKHLVDSRCRWQRIDDDWSFFEADWKPKSWPSGRRVLVLRHRVHKRRKGPLQLDLYEPRDFDFEYKVIVTDKTESPGSILSFHNGRGIQEGLLGEAKSWAQLDYIPCRRLVANKIYMLASLFAHNLGREFQMATAEPNTRRSVPTRGPLWTFWSLSTIRNLLIRRAGAITRPQRKLTMAISATGEARDEFEKRLHLLQAA